MTAVLTNQHSMFLFAPNGSVDVPINDYQSIRKSIQVSDFSIRCNYACFCLHLLINNQVGTISHHCLALACFAKAYVKRKRMGPNKDPQTSLQELHWVGSWDGSWEGTRQAPAEVPQGTPQTLGSARDPLKKRLRGSLGRAKPQAFYSVLLN